MLKNMKKTVMSTNLILCILIYMFKLKNIIQNQNSIIPNSNDNKSSNLLNLKKITDLGVDLVSKNYIGFLFHLMPYSTKIINFAKRLREKKLSNDKNN